MPFLKILWILLAVLFILYGIVILSIGSGTGFFLVWFALGAISLVCAWFAEIHLWSGLPAPAKSIIAVLIIIVLAIFLCVEGQIVRSFHHTPEKDLDYLLVLGAQVHEQGPSIVLKYRLDTAADYLEQNPETLCIVSGGQGPNEPFPEAAGMKQYLLEKGIAEERILTEDASRNTKENMEFSRKLLTGNTVRVGIVTNDFHIYRAMALARQADFANVQAVPAPSSVPYLPNNLLREFLGVMKDWLVGNIPSPFYSIN
ncbi:MAG: YdcF family protein [Lachnospiraceae bacterium]|nr:YdcF family protein [Lachnospiraceae bacterium]